MNTHICVSKCKVYIFFLDTTKNLEKSPKIQSKFEFMNEQVPKFSFKKLIHLSTQNLNLGLEFKTGQNHPVNRTKNNTGWRRLQSRISYFLRKRDGHAGIGGLMVMGRLLMT